MNKTIEEKTAESMLHLSTPLCFAGKEYSVAPPTMATLMLASAKISKLPFELKSKDVDVVSYALKYAQYADLIAEVIAIFLLGEKNLRRKVEKRSWRGISRTVEEDNVQPLADELMQSSPSELLEGFIGILERQEIADFFELTISLAGINTAKATKEMGNETTVPGQ